MPKALAIDHQVVKLIAQQVGVREAARQCGLSEETVKSWSKREGWLVELDGRERLQEQATRMLREKQGLPPVAPSPADVLRDLNGKTRLGHAKHAFRVAERLESLPEEKLLEMVPEALAAAKHASIVHSWASQGTGSSIRLDLLAGTLEIASDGSINEMQIPD